ncbi:hypothetical protein NMP99_02970 [Glutamicibacter mishrai]|uniref:hypothetical protein n=1 Tax=Glutamicibacter mishrai TaxID=1775880 RepID=UPI0020CCDD7F|nr:hypothetical protein [Glutamicibacter mishrai]UTT40237.1 hypothetical protein NMP99_02680 [Glutamicibacter mishrai]UTT40288.1 hypothetical protein NMP99_02970 [Glutamicibacter mishrai]
MTTTTEAQRLTGVDRKKHVKFTGPPPRNLTYEGRLVQVKHLGDGGTTLVIETDDGRLDWEHVDASAKVTLTGIHSRISP